MSAAEPPAPDPNANSQRIHLWKWLIRYTRFVYKRPYVPILFTILLTAGLTVWLLLGFGVMPGGNTNNYRWSGHNTTDRWDAYVGAGKGTYPSLFGMLGATIPLPKQFQLTQMGCIIYECPGCNIVTAEAFRKMWKMEFEMHTTPGWENYCFKVPLDSLPKFLANPVRGLIGSMKEILAPLESDEFGPDVPSANCIAFKSIFTDLTIWMQSQYPHLCNFSNINACPDALTDSMIWDFFNFTGDYKHFDTANQTYMGIDLQTCNESASGLFGTRMRSMFPFALPIAGYRNKADREAEQTAKLGKWQIDLLKPVRKMQAEQIKAKNPVAIPYTGFPFALNYDIADLILAQVWWLVGSFGFLFLFSIFAMRSFFVSLLGAMGIFFPIPCALVVMNGVCQIRYIDAIDVIALFLICGIGADCMFIIFELFKQARVIYGKNNKRRLAYAAQRGIIALATSISTSGVSFLALLTSGVRVMNFFGVYAFLLLLFTFIYTFSWFLGILSIWAAYFEPQQPGPEAQDFDTINSQAIQSKDETSSTTSTADLPEIHYPHPGVLDFLSHRPVFKVDAANIDIAKYNIYERVFYNYIAPCIYFYRLPIITFFLAWSVVFGVFACKMGTKSELTFLGPMNPLQRAYELALNGFSTALNDYSFVFVWGIKPTPKVKFAERLTVDSYGSAEFYPIDITNPDFQDHLNWTWRLLNNSHPDVINANVTVNFGASPWEMWNTVFEIGRAIQTTTLNESITITVPIWDFNFTVSGQWERPLNDILFTDCSNVSIWVTVDWFGSFPLGDYLKNSSICLDMTPIPQNATELRAHPEEYDSWGWLWQLFLSILLYQEPDSYVPGTLKANTVGFSFEDYTIAYIGMKANMYIPVPLNADTQRALFAKASAIEDEINEHARNYSSNVPQGWMTSVAWLTMITEEELPKQVIKDVGAAFGFAAIVILCSTLSVLYTLYVIISMLSTIFLILGILYFTGWKIGCNEAIMVSIASGFCADFIIQPMIALSHDYSGRSLFGKIQASLVTFCTPVSCALVTTLVAAAFLYPCQILMFPPFATFLLGSGIFGIIHGFIVLPAWIGLFSFNRRKPCTCDLCGKPELGGAGGGTMGKYEAPLIQPSNQLFATQFQ